MDTLQHWRYFIALEREFTETLRYVEYTPNQQSVFSFELARLLMLACSELDVVFKVACATVAPNASPDSIGAYFECLSKKYRLVSEEVRVDRYSEVLKPFDGWTKDHPPAWWSAYNKVKHRRHEHFELASLKNTIHALTGLFVGNLLALNELGLISNVFDGPILLGRDSEPGHLMVETGYKVDVL
jgi:hypothetical protein